MLHHVGLSLVTCLLHCSQLSKSRANCHVGAAGLGPARSYNIRQRRRTHGVGGGQLPDHWWSYYSVISVTKVRLLAYYTYNRFKLFGSDKGPRYYCHCVVHHYIQDIMLKSTQENWLQRASKLDKSRRYFTWARAYIKPNFMKALRKLKRALVFSQI